jgi:SAM-dependent methyltransferase
MKDGKLKRFLGKYIVPLTPVNIPEIRGILLKKDIDNFLKNVKIKGKVLDVGSQKAPYRKYFNKDSYSTLDIDQSCNPDILCDAHNMICKSNTFQMVLAIEVLEHCYEPKKVVDEIYRVLKPGGICLVSVPFMYRYHFGDYYRFTKEGLGHLFKKFLNVKIKGQGNRLHLLWDNLHGGSLFSKFLLNSFNPLIANIGKSGNSHYSLGYILIAKKPYK